MTDNDGALPAVTGLLTTTEAARLAECEAAIERGLRTFIEVGEALLSIRDDRLYRDRWETFEAYCRERWGLGRRRAYQLMEAAAVSTMVHTANLPAPANERQARELVPLRDDEVGLVEVYREARAMHGAELSAKEIRRVVRARLEIRAARQRPGTAEADRERIAAVGATPAGTVLTTTDSLAGQFRRTAESIDHFRLGAFYGMMRGDPEVRLLRDLARAREWAQAHKLTDVEPVLAEAAAAVTSYVEQTDQLFASLHKLEDRWRRQTKRLAKRLEAAADVVSQEIPYVRWRGMVGAGTFIWWTQEPSNGWTGMSAELYGDGPITVTGPASKELLAIIRRANRRVIPADRVSAG